MERTELKEEISGMKRRAIIATSVSSECITTEVNPVPQQFVYAGLQFSQLPHSLVIGKK